uniref:Vesicular inhibitory amino acid transporter n=1 Tax=Stegastes partitus TaxID=144197 RepID=A0A3B5AD35_9TELE
ASLLGAVPLTLLSTFIFNMSQTKIIELSSHHMYCPQFVADLLSIIFILTASPPAAIPKSTRLSQGVDLKENQCCSYKDKLSATVLSESAGIFVLGLPFALVQSGYVGLVLLVVSAWVCNHTGRTLVACLYEEEQRWDFCYILLSGVAVPRSVCSLVVLMFLLPCLLLTDLRPVSTLSLLCSLAHILISLLVILYCLSRASSWSWSSLSLSVDPENFIVSVGVIIFSYTSQIFLPPLEGSMEDRGQFSAMLGWTHGAACIMKTMFSLLAVLTWGAETREVITDNLPSDLRPLVNLCLLAKALLSYPLPFYSALVNFSSFFLLPDAAVSSYSKHGGGGVSRPALVVRGTLLMASYLLALLVPRFSLLMGLTGSVTGAAMTLILPCLFHLRLQWGQLTVKDRLIDVAILTLGVMCSVSGVICSLKRLVEGLVPVLLPPNQNNLQDKANALTPGPGKAYTCTHLFPSRLL